MPWTEPSDEAEVPLTGYLDDIEVAPGGRVGVHMSGPNGGARVELARLTYAGNSPGLFGGYGFDEVPTGAPTDNVPIRPQAVHPGSYLSVPHQPSPTGCYHWSWQGLILPARSTRVVLAAVDATSSTGVAVCLTPANSLEVRTRTAGRWKPLPHSGISLPFNKWGRWELVLDGTLIALNVDGLGLRHQLVAELPAPVAETTTTYISGLPAAVRDDLQCCDGRVEAPQLRTGQFLAFDFDFSHDMAATRAITGTSAIGQVHAELHNCPARAVTGTAWDGSTSDWRYAPAQYAAVEFHHDDLTDCGWDTTTTVTIGEDTPSGLYEAKVSSGGQVSRLPLVVGPTHATTARVALLLPTFTWQAYANEHIADGNGRSAGPRYPHAPAQHRNTAAGTAPGLSTYDRHASGPGCRHSSLRRPVANLGPDHVTWLYDGPRGLGGDLSIIGYLDQLGVEYDVITDHRIEREGADAVAAYDVLITGSHPEYVTEREWRVLRDFAERRRLMYLGGNGFYWTCALAADSGVLEVRRGHSGTRMFDGELGEGVLAASASPGGCWRHLGKGPHTWLGVGFVSEGWGTGRPYRRSVPRGTLHDWVFAGVNADVFGDYGYGLNGAAGDEIDSYDPVFGSPADATVLASSFGHDASYLLAHENLPSLGGPVTGEDNPTIRADLVLVEHGGGGRVFSVSSIMWASALPHNQWDNDVATITGNVLAQFLAETAAPGTH